MTTSVCMPCRCDFTFRYPPMTGGPMTETPTPPAPDPAPAPQPDPTTPAPSPTQPTQ